MDDRRHVYRGHVFHVAGSPTVHEADAHLVSWRDGAVAVDGDGAIGWAGPYAELPDSWLDAPVTRSAFVIPGFVDAHIHLPQTYSTSAYGGGQLLEWLEHCIFPAEARLADPAFAEQIAADFTARRLAVGTTAAMVFGSAFPHAQDALYHHSLAAGLRTVSGRGIQVVGPASAAPLMTGEDEAIELAGTRSAAGTARIRRTGPSTSHSSRSRSCHGSASRRHRARSPRWASSTRRCATGVCTSTRT